MSLDELRATAEEQRIIGGLMARLDSIEKHQESIRVENRADHEKLFGKIETIAKLAPSVERHEKDIAELKSRPERLIGVGAALVATCSAVGTFLLWFLSFTRGH